MQLGQAGHRLLRRGRAPGSAIYVAAELEYNAGVITGLADDLDALRAGISFTEWEAHRAELERSVLRRDAQWNALLAVYDQLDETVETGHAPPWVGRMIALAHWIRDAVGPVS